MSAASARWCWRPAIGLRSPCRSGPTSGCSRAGPSWWTRPRRGCWSRPGGSLPSEGYPTGGEWIERYLAPLAEALGDQVRLGARVTGVSRKGRDRLVDADRGSQPFTVHVSHTDGSEERLDARAVIDASGTWTTPNPAGADGLPALGERAAAGAGLLSYLPPTPAQAQALAGKHTVIVGSGHSAMTAVIELAAVADAVPGTRVSWVLRRGAAGVSFGGGTADQLPQRGALGLAAKAAVDKGFVDLVTGFRTDRVELVGRASRAGVRGRPDAAAGRADRGADRIPPGPVLPVGDAPGAGHDAAGAGPDRRRD